MAITRLSEAREWLDKAEHDLRSAKLLSSPDNPVYDTALFHCQQTAEKALKGFLFMHRVLFEKTHNLGELTDLDPGLASLRPDANLLSPYAVRFRYPAPIKGPDAAEFKAGFAAAERIYRFVLAKHPELDPEKT